MKRAFWLKNLFLIACLLLTAIPGFSQNKTVTGTVTDATGEPLIGASVLQQGTSNGVITDVDGKYSIQVPPEATLEFSYVGMVKQAVKVGNRSVIDVQMNDDSQMLAETVVIGYGSAKKRDLTGSITNIKGDEIANKPVVNPVAALQGKIAGVQVINSGKAGADPEIRVRGTNSINGYKPLYVVDGLFNDNINFLNPQDIESMEILKDPSSLAIFGVRGANGVIIITTKKAKEGQTRININGSFGFKRVTDKIAMVDAAGFKELYNEQLRNEGNPEFDFTPWTGNTDWQDEIFQTGFITNNNVSITGASARHSFYLGAGYAYEQGNIKHEKYSKVTLNISNDYKVTDNFKVGFQFNGARILPADTKSVATALRAAPVAPVYNAEYGLYTTLPGFQKAQMNNPMVDVDLKANTTRAENYRASGNVYGQWDFLKNFQFKVMYSMDYASNSSRTYTPIITVFDSSVEGNVVTLGNGKTGVRQSKETEAKVQSDYLLTYTNSWGEHSLTATAGFTTYYNKLEMLGGERTQGVGLVIPNNPDKWYISIGDAATATNESKQWERSTVSMLGRVLYNYKGRYLFNGSFRRDGSSAFSYTGNQWQNFYSIGAGWLMSEEEFMKDITWLDMLKLKGSWGTLGNQNLAGGDAASYYPTTPNLALGHISMNGTPASLVTLNTLANPDIKWETTTMLDVGVDVTLFSKLNITADWYRKNTDDILMKLDIPAGVGLNAPYQNAGKVRNTGWELSIGYNNRWRDFTFGVQANVSDVKNEIVYMRGKTATSGVLRNQEGYSIGSIYALESLGIIRTQEEADWVNANCPQFKETVQIGDIRYADIDGSNTIDENDKTIVGSTIPRYTYSLNLDFGWKGLRLSMLFQGVGKTDGYLNTYYVMPSNQGGTFRKEHIDFACAANPGGVTPRLTSANKNNWYDSSFWMKSAAYLRLKNIQLGYDLPKSWMRKIGLKSAYVYVNAQNLFTAPNFWDGYDPEVGYDGDASGDFDLVKLGSANNYPQVKLVTIGLDLKF